MALTNLSQVTSSGIHTLSNYTTHNINSTGIITATEFSGNLSNSSGISTFAEIRVTGNLTVDGTTTTLDTVLTEVDKLEVGANNNTVGVAITQSGSGDILRLYDGSSQVVTVDDEGQIGIGANAPSANLDIAETGFVNVKVRTSGNNSATLNLQNSQRNFSVNNVTGGAFTIHDSTANAERLRITSGGDVGIGTNNPRTDLQVGAFGGGDSNIQLATGTSGASNILFGDGSGGSDYYKGFIKYNHSTDNLELYSTDDIIHYTDGSERLRINSNGRVGIATAVPGAILDVEGTLLVGTSGVIMVTLLLTVMS